MQGSLRFEAGAIVGGRFRIDSLLGSGGLGDVYAATDLSSEDRVALKTVRLQTGYTKEMLHREARLYARIHHPVVAPTQGAFEEDGQVFIVQKLVEGGTPLDHWQKDRTQREILDLYSQLAYGVAALHARDVVHRDLKPSNVLVAEGKPIIIDLGLAVLTSEPDDLTGPGTIVGSAVYLAPETILGEVFSPAVDVYALGLMLAEALRGKGVWDGEGDFFQLVSSRLRGNFPKEVQTWLAKLQPRKLAATIASMLSRNPSERPSAAEVAATLQLIVRPPSVSVTPAPNATLEAPNAKTEQPLGSRYRHSRTGRLLLLGLWVVFSAWMILNLFSIDAVSQRPKLYPPFSDAPFLAVPGILELQVSIWLVTSVAGSAFLVAAVVRLRRARAAWASDEEVARRLIAIEKKVQDSDAMSRSFAIELQSVKQQIDQERLAQLVRASVLVALQDIEAAGDVPLKKIAEVVSALRESTGSSSKGGSPSPSRITTILTISGSGVAVVAGLVGLLNTTELWHPRRAPEITSFGPPEVRLRAGLPTFLTVSARDPQGDPLIYSFRTSAGSVEGKGNSVLWTPPVGPSDRLVELTVAVSNRSRTSVASRSLMVNSPPTIKLHVPPRVSRNSVALLRATKNDPDGDATKIVWKVSCGELLDTTDETAFWRTPNHSCEAVIVCEADDGWERRSTTANVLVD